MQVLIIINQAGSKSFCKKYSDQPELVTKQFDMMMKEKLAKMKIKFFALVLACVSFHFNVKVGTFSGHGRAVGFPITFGVLCTWFPSFFSNLSSLGIKGSSPQDVPSELFSFLGWVLLLLSLIPITL